ncbi:MAG: glycosyltransferase family 2 protein [Planctomycetes bacterium]|nr:glycosyltransferase family 2 protein [Planctomycetota bacterium]
MPSLGTPFSLCVITKDEEARISRCLASVPFAADVVVLDSGSGDRTVELAARAGARTFVEPFRGHVLQKARAVELARHDWVLCLDADEELSPELAAAISRALAAAAAPGHPIGFALARKTWYAGRFIEHSGWWPEWRLRLFDRRCGGWTGSDPHDRVEVSGPIARLDGALWHYAYRDLEHHLDKVNRYTTTMARGMAAAGTRFGWSDVLFRPAARFVRMYLVRRGFLDGGRGFVLATIGAFYVFLKYAKLWERTRAGGEPPSGATSRR